MNVYKAINAVQGDLVKHGIGKDSTNTYDGYKFRGIDAVYNALSPLLAKHGLCILPRMLSRTCEERASQKGGALFYVTVDAEFDFVCAEDGSKHTIKTFGEAMDRGDKATNKAMSAAYKYAAFQAFAIPTEGDNDADAQTHEVEPKRLNTATEVMGDAFRALQPDEQTLATDWASQAEKLAQHSISDAYEDLEANLASLNPDSYNDWKMAVAYKLTSKTRNALKAHGQQLRKAA
jgi:hypothetical protein